MYVNCVLFLFVHYLLIYLNARRDNKILKL